MPNRTNQSKRGMVLAVLKQSFAKLSEKQRHALAADLGITPVFNVHFVKAVDGRPEGESHG